jgi:hypothetical protein
MVKSQETGRRRVRMTKGEDSRIIQGPPQLYSDSRRAPGLGLDISQGPLMDLGLPDRASACLSVASCGSAGNPKSMGPISRPNAGALTLQDKE